MQSLLTLLCAVGLGQAPAAAPVAPPAGFPGLKAGAIVRVTTAGETISGVVEEGSSADFLRLKAEGAATYVRRSAIETIRVLPDRPAAAVADAALVAAGPDPNRYVVYVHGICRHQPGFSKTWFDAMKKFTPRIVAANVREVVWSDVVRPATAALRPPGTPAEAAEAPATRTEEQRRLEDSLRAILRDRAEQAASEGGAARDQAAPAGHDMVTTSSLFGDISDVTECVDDFVLYMTVGAIREAILAKFDRAVLPLLEAGAEIEIISHSWGTVIAYEGLRRLESRSSGSPAGKVHNLFTLGSALSVWPVRVNLAERIRGGQKPRLVTRWVNLDARFDVVGGHIQGAPFAVDVERLNLPPIGCSFPISPICAHSSYFDSRNLLVNQEILGYYIDESFRF